MAGPEWRLGQGDGCRLREVHVGAVVSTAGTPVSSAAPDRRPLQGATGPGRPPHTAPGTPAHDPTPSHRPDTPLHLCRLQSRRAPGAG